ncbi:MAG TPA: XrtA/PEP-CTERM system histidine kinase PrsK [Vicinamibacteria bacterium]|nr:XrtA/PEP-CTERM system histidine kinase PrsK [Vicinamibacteria bacterium]
MKFDVLLSCLSAMAALSLAGFLLRRHRQETAHAILAVGFLVFAAREGIGVLSTLAASESDALMWHRYRFVVAAAIPGLWLCAALTFARATPFVFLRRWRFVLVAAFLLPSALVVGGWHALVMRAADLTPTLFVPVGTAGVGLHGILVMSAVAVLVNFERTLRASAGSVRWQIKFAILGLGALFGVEVFLDSQVLLYSVVQTTLFPIGSGALLLACGLIAFSIARRRLASVELYPSDALLFRSLTLLVVGIYFLGVVGVVELIDRLGGRQWPPAVAIFVLLATLGLATLFLSTRFQLRARRWLSRHLARPAHDYRRIWDRFTRDTSAAMEIEPLCAAITKIAVETFGCPSATIWLVREGERKLLLGGTSAMSAAQANATLNRYADGRDWLAVMAGTLDRPIDLRDPRLPEAARELEREIDARYSVALLGNDGCPIGFLTLSERFPKQPFSLEDLALMKTLADQSAATIRNRQLARDLRRAREMEAFQAVSTFFVHDLKNLASRLSLAMQNLPAHIDKPEFRHDVLRMMDQSVRKIDTMTSRLSSLTSGLSLKRTDCDLNHLVRKTVATLNGSMKARVSIECCVLPSVRIDSAEMQKVLTNLVLNAQEATGESGNISVRTSAEKGWVLLSVADDGCGMSPEFITHSLFRPFQTTKKSGLGIGLYQCKTIVEAHGGRIEVQSERQKGSTFNVLLPVQMNDA